MQANVISEKISYIPCEDSPLSADIGIIRDNGTTWLYDVGDGENRIPELNETCNVILSHFHQDHIGNLDRISVRELFVSKETYAHTHRGTLVTESFSMGNLRIFPIPSSHTKGCLGLEIDETYAFVGDALYSKVKAGHYVYNAQLLQEEIAVLKKLHAPFLLVSHFLGMVRSKEEVLKELEEIYAQRVRNSPEIIV